jgi:hypothetical protein
MAQRKVIGSVITTKARYVTSIQECSRRYGIHAKTKIVEGVVVEVVVDRSNPTSQAQTYIVAGFILGSDREKRVRVHIRFTQLKEVLIPLITPPNAVSITVLT